jgi:hypothetical protein
MPCCTTILQTFSNQSTTVIAYVGNRPTVTVTYLIDGVWYAMGVFTQIVLTATQVIIDHGSSSATGVVKIVQ